MAGHLTGLSGAANLASTSTFVVLGSFLGQGQSATETNVSWVTRNAGTWSKLQAYITANGSSSVVMRFRVNTGNGNQLLSIGSTANTYFEDTSNSDTVAAGDALNLIYTAANTNVVTLAVLASLFTPSGADYVFRGGVESAGGISFTAASTDNLLPPYDAFGTGQTDLTSRAAIEVACTAKNLYSNVATNARTTTTNMRLWKNNAAANLVIPYTSGQTGIKEDTSNTDSIAVGDTVQFALSTAAVDTGSIVAVALFGDFTSTTGSVPYIGGSGGYNANTTRYIAVLGRANNNVTVEAERQLKPECDGVFEKSSIVVQTNTITATSNLRVRVNSNPGNNVRAIGSGATGTIIDTTNSDTVVASDLVTTELTTGATGTSMQGRQTSIVFSATVSAVKDIIQMGIIPFARA